MINDSINLRKALFMAPNLSGTIVEGFLPIGPIFQVLPNIDPSLKIGCLLKTHWYERLRQPPRLKLLDRFITQPPIRASNMWVDLHAPATNERHRFQVEPRRSNLISGILPDPTLTPTLKA